MARIIGNLFKPPLQDAKDGREARTLDSFVRAADEAGVSLASLPPMARLLVRTRNTLYRIVVLGPGPTVLVEGGRCFPQPTEVQLCGSSLGTGALKTFWIGFGFHMELSGPTKRVITSAVRSVVVEGGSVHGPF